MQTLAYLGPQVSEEDIIYTLINSSGPISVDTETISLKNKQAIGIGIQISDQDRYFFRVFPEPSRYLPIVAAMLQDKTRAKIYHNCKGFDLDVLSEFSPDDINVEDTYFKARVLGIESNLDYIGKNLLGFDDMFSIPELLQETSDLLEEPLNKLTMLDVPFPKIALKCMNDVRATWFANQKLSSMMNANMQEEYELDRWLIHEVRSMEAKGLPIDQELLQSKKVKYEALVEEYGNKCADHGFNPWSPQQVAMFMATNGIMLPMNRAKTGLRTDLDALLDHIDFQPAYDTLMARKYRKLLSTYVLPYEGIDIAHTEFRFDLATGRFASEGENWQNIPPDMRDIFVGPFTWLDASQIEMRIFAFFSQDPVMLDIYRTGGDIHFSTQSDIWPGSERSNEALRLAAKTTNFSMVFYAREGTILKSIRENSFKAGIRSNVNYGQVREFRKVWLNKFYVGRKWMDAQLTKTEPYAETYFGRRMKLPDGPTEDHIGKCRINYPVQGTAGGWIKRAMKRCKDLDKRVQVHDELVFNGLLDDEVFKELELDRIIPEYPIPYSVKRGAKWI